MVTQLEVTCDFLMVCESRVPGMWTSVSPTTGLWTDTFAIPTGRLRKGRPWRAGRGVPSRGVALPWHGRP